MKLSPRFLGSSQSLLYVVGCIAAIALLLKVAVARQSLSPGHANPFRGVDVTRLVSQTSSFHHPPYEFPDSTREYDSERYEINGVPDATHSVSGLLSTGDWVLVVPFGGGTAMIYRWKSGRPVPVSALHATTQLRSLTVHAGALELEQLLYAPIGTCRAIGREVRRFGLERGNLREIARFTLPHGVAETLTSPLPNTPESPGDRGPFSQVSGGEQFAARTPGLYRICAWYGYPYFVSDLRLYGMPALESAVTFRGSDGTWLIAIPFVSGGTGGVFSGAVYRLERRHPILVRALHSSNGHMSFRVDQNHLQVVTPLILLSECCYSKVQVRTYSYDPTFSRLSGVSSTSMSTSKRTPPPR
jgi:hypothetical protein